MTLELSVVRNTASTNDVHKRPTVFAEGALWSTERSFYGFLNGLRREGASDVQAEHIGTEIFGNGRMVVDLDFLDAAGLKRALAGTDEDCM